MSLGERVSRHGVTALGVVLLVASVVQVLVLPSTTGHNVREVVVPLGLAVFLVWRGSTIARSDRSARTVWRAVQWTYAGGLAFGLLGLWSWYLLVQNGLEVIDAVPILLLATAVGGASGVVFGRSNADLLEQTREAERGAAAFRASMDGIATVAADGTHVEVNQAYAEMYGHESRGALVGEPIQMVYAPSAVPTLESEVLSALDPGERWRDPLLAERRDGVEFPQEVSIVRLESGEFVCLARDVTDQRRHEQDMAALHEATREMMSETDPEIISKIAVETARDVLDHPITAIWLRDETGDRLKPVAQTRASADLFEELPVYEAGNSHSWTVYESGEATVVDDVGDLSNPYDAASPVRSEVIVPIGEFGVLNSGATFPGAFEENDVLLAKLLAANTAAALDRAERERRLERQTDQMEFFNSILRHDVLNGMTVIRSRAEFLAERVDGEERRFANTIVNWSDDVVEIVSRVRHVLETLTEEDETRSFGAVDLAGVIRRELRRVEETYQSVTFTADVPEAVPVRGDDLLSDVIGNLLTNAVEHNDRPDLEVAVTVTPGDPVTVRIADNGAGVADDRKQAIFRRGETGHAKSTGSGFGLFFVDAMVTEYGGSVNVEDTPDGGAAFVVELPRPSEPNNNG